MGERSWMAGPLTFGGSVSGKSVDFFGDQMASIVQAIRDVGEATGQVPVVVGGLAVLCRLSSQHRATTDLDVVDRLLGPHPQLEVLREIRGAESREPAAVVLPTRFGLVKVDVLEVRQIEIDMPSDNPGDRLFASAHAWAHDTATPVLVGATSADGEEIRANTLVAEPGPLVAMKLQAVMDRDTAKQGTDLHDIIRLTLDRETREPLLEQLAACDDQIARDVASHVTLWLVDRRVRSLGWVNASGGPDVTADDIDLTAELLVGASRRAPADD